MEDQPSIEHVNTEQEDRKPDGAELPAAPPSEEENDPEIEALVDEIKETFQEAFGLFQRGAMRAIKGGELLIQLQEKAGHGNWLKRVEKLAKEYKFGEPRTLLRYKWRAEKLMEYPELRELVTAELTMSALDQAIKEKDEAKEREKEAKERVAKAKRQRVDEQTNECLNAISHMIRVVRAHRKLYEEEFDYAKWVSWLRHWKQDPGAIETVIDSPIPYPYDNEPEAKTGNNITESATE